MVGWDNYSGSDGQTLPTNCPENNQSKTLEKQRKVLEKGGVQKKKIGEKKKLKPDLFVH